MKADFISMSLFDGVGNSGIVNFLINLKIEILNL